MINGMDVIISNKDFNYRLSMELADNLEEYSQKTWKTLHEKDKIFYAVNVEERFPAYINTGKKIPSIVVKFPTYVIDVYGKKESDEAYKEIKELLCNQEGYFDLGLYSIQSFVENNNISSIPRIKCIDFGLENNILLREKIVQTLEEAGYRTTYSVDINYVECPIEFVDNANTQFRVICS